MLNLLTTPLPPYAYTLIGIGFVSLFALRGMFRGFFNELFGILSLAAAYLLAIPFGLFLMPFLPDFGLPSMFLEPIAMACGGIIAYVTARFEFFLIGILFHLKEKKKGPKKNLIRIGGAVLGAAFGLLIVMIISWFVLLMGKLTAQIPAFNPTVQEGVEQVKDDSLITLPARMVDAHRKGLEESTLGEVAEETSPVPESVDKGLDVAGEILKDPGKMQKLVEYEPVAEVLQGQIIQGLMEDEEIKAMAAEGDIFGIMNHPKTQEMLNDPEIQETLEGIDMNELLDALGIE